MTSQHLKRTNMPKSWPVKRKNITFIAKPNPGSHKLKYISSLVIILRDVLKYASTFKEAKRIIYQEDLFINSKKVQDVRTAFGMFDLLEIKKLNEKYTLLFDETGRIKLVPTKDDLIYLKVSKKTVTAGKKYQINFMNGFNLLVSEKEFIEIKVNDTVVYDLVKKKIDSIINLKIGNFVYIFDGKFQGKFGEIISFTSYKGVAKDVVTLKINGIEHSTAKDFCYVIGNKSSDLARFE